MLRDTVEELAIETMSAEAGPAPTWASPVRPVPARTERAARASASRTDRRAEPKQDSPLDWRTVDRALRTIRCKRAALDADEARWLRAAEDLQIWRPLGMVSALDYLERVLGYAPRTAQDRLRVARALGTLPEMSAALATDALSHSAVRELTRVATPATEAAWIEAARGKNLRQIEELVADHKPGDRPDDPPDPEARTRVVRFELSPDTFALLRQARTVLDDERGTDLADDDFVAALCHAVLDGGLSAEPTGRAKFQIAVTVCARCQQGWQEGAGVQVAIDAAAVERAMCDAQHIGSLDGSGPERAYQDIPPAVVRFVWRRDGGRCRVPGCRSARGLEVHHLVHRADGGTHEATNLCLLCSSCHLAHHRGALAIRGTADQLEVRRFGDPEAASEGAVTRRERSVGDRAYSDRRAHVGGVPQPSIGRCGAERHGAGSSAGGSSAGGSCAGGSCAGGSSAGGSGAGRSSAGRSSAGGSSAGGGSAGGGSAGGSCTGGSSAGGSGADRSTADRSGAGRNSAGGCDADGSGARGPGASGRDASGWSARSRGTADRDADGHGNDDRRAGSCDADGRSVDDRGADRRKPAASRRGVGCKLDMAVLRTEAKDALVDSGWTATIARAAVAAAAEALGPDVTLERLVFESFRRCPKV